MIEQTANATEAILRAALAAFALGLNLYIVWHYYGKEIRAWWREHIARYWQGLNARQDWVRQWSAIWQIETQEDA